MSQINDTEIDTELQRVRDALKAEDPNGEVAAVIAEAERWGSFGCPYETRRRHKTQLCRLLAPVEQRRQEQRRGLTLEQYLRLVRRIGRSPIDFSRIAGGGSPQAA